MRVTWRHYFHKFAGDYTLGLVCLLLTQGIGAAVPLAIKAMLDHLQSADPQVSVLLQYAGGVMGLITVMFGVRVLSRYFLIGVGRKIDYDVRMGLYRHLLQLPRSYYDLNKTGDLMSRLTNDLTALRMAMGGSVMLMANTILAYAIVLPTMLWLSWPLTLMAFVLYPLGVWLMKGLSVRIKKAYLKVQAHLGDISDMTQETMSAITTIQSYAVEAEQSNRFYKMARGYYEAFVRLIDTRVVMYLLMALVGGVSHWVILAEGGREVISGGFTISSLVAFMLYLERLDFPTVSLGWVLSSIQQGEGARQRINEIFSAPLPSDDSLTEGLAQWPEGLAQWPEGPIEIKGLYFRFDNPYDPAQPEKPVSSIPWVLSDINLQAHV